MSCNEHIFRLQCSIEARAQTYLNWLSVVCLKRRWQTCEFYLSILYLDKRYDESVHIKSLNLKWKLWVCAKNKRIKCNFERSHALPVCTHTLNVCINSLSHEHSSIAIWIEEKKNRLFYISTIPFVQLYALRTHIHFPVDSLRVVVVTTITVLMHFTLIQP